MADPQLMTTEIHYPETDQKPMAGTDRKPMAESDTHRDQMTDLIHCLRDWFEDDPQVYVTGSLLLYYEEDDPQASVAPDVFVARGVEDHPRRAYRLWEEGKGPDLVIEITSRGTRIEDLGNKKALCADMGVEEYFIYDPLGEWLTPSLALYRLDRGEYVRVKAATDRLTSQVTGLELGLAEGRLRVFDPASGKMLPTAHEEAGARRKEAKARCEAEARAEHLAQELERLRRQLDDRGTGR